VGYDPSAVADLDMDGVVGRGSHSHEVSKMTKGLDDKDQLWHTGHARWRSSPSAGFPTPTSLDGPHRVFCSNGLPETGLAARINRRISARRCLSIEIFIQAMSDGADQPPEQTTPAGEPSNDSGNALVVLPYQ
jgi:hypothetical protein